MSISTECLLSDPDPATAVLVIRVDDAIRASWIAGALERWRARRGHDVRTGRALKLEIDDLQGRRHATLNAAGPLTRLLLPVGTYVVTATRAGRARRYTLALESGCACELDVRLAPV